MMNEKINFLPILQKNEPFRDALYHIPDLGIALLDSNGYFLTANQFFSEELGYASDEILKMNYRCLTSPPFLDNNNRGFNDLVEGKKADHSLIKKIYRKDGSSIFVRVKAFQFHSEIGDRKKVLCFYLKDMTIRFQLAAEIIYKNCHIPPENSTMGILVFDTLTGKINIAHGPYISSLGLTEKTLETLFFIDQIMTEDTMRTIGEISQKAVSIPQKIKATLVCHKGNEVHLLAKVLRFQWNSCAQKREKVFLSFYDYEIKEKSLVKIEKEITQIKELAIGISEKLSENKEEKQEEEKPSFDIGPYNLTPREKTILIKFSELNTVKEIAFDLRVAEVTVRKHLTKIYRKFNVTGREELLLQVYNKHFIN